KLTSRDTKITSPEIKSDVFWRALSTLSSSSNQTLKTEGERLANVIVSFSYPYLEQNYLSLDFKAAEAYPSPRHARGRRINRLSRGLVRRGPGHARRRRTAEVFPRARRFM